MESLLNAVQWFFNLIGTLIDFVVNIFSSLIEFISMLPSIITFTMNSVGYLPEAVASVAIIAIVVAITLLILGRSNN